MEKQGGKIEIKRSFRKIFRITFLLLVREFYSFLVNLYGLVCHPFLTLNHLKKERDFSQGILVLGLPGYFWLGTIVFLAVFRSLIGIRGGLGWIAQSSLLIISLIAILFLGYLFYWLLKILRSFSGDRK